VKLADEVGIKAGGPGSGRRPGGGNAAIHDTLKQHGFEGPKYNDETAPKYTKGDHHVYTFDGNWQHRQLDSKNPIPFGEQKGSGNGADSLDMHLKKKGL
jgi:hypothetical protein